MPRITALPGKHFAVISRTALAHVVLAAVIGSLCALPCQAQEEYPRPAEATRTYQVLLLGNTGSPSPDDLTPTLDLLKRQLATAGEESAVVFLGDQLYDGGMPEAGAPGRAEAERQLMQLIEAVRDYAGKVYFIPGDQDYGATGADGLAALQRQEAFIEEQLHRGNVFRPDAGSLGPADVKLKDGLRLVMLDTEGLLQNASSKDRDDGEEPIEVYARLTDIIRQRNGDDLVLVAHHPLYSNGRYGGHRSPYYLLPGLGTVLYAIQRARRNADVQYFSHRHNEWMRYALESTIAVHQDLLFVAAQDYSLQYFDYDKTNKTRGYAVSGSAARSEFVAQRHWPKGYHTKLATSEKGFLSLHLYADGSMWLDAWGVTDDGSGRRLSQNRIRRPELNPEPPPLAADATLDYADSTITLVSEPGYKAGLIRKIFLGPNRRAAWTAPVALPYLDLGVEAGGLTPVKRGGGNQTTSIRLETSEGKQYTMRSVRKNGRLVLPLPWQNTFVGSVVHDAMSFAHPYAALAVPKMAEAVGVRYANPKLLYLPKDPRLGAFLDLVGGSPVFVEERPNKDDWSDAPWFGNPPEVVGWAEMYRNVTRDNDHRVDTRALARARLFDMWLADWDRHKDQWRWGVFDDPDGDGHLYRPIPRDRDQAFGRVNFLLAPLVMRFFPSDDYKKSFDVKGLTFSGLMQDHRFLSNLDRSDWLEIADSIEHALTDEDIRDGLSALPPEVFAIEHEELFEVGKIRRAKLPWVADKFYRLHAERVDVVGTDKHERFEVTRLNDDDTEVVMYKTTKEGEIRQELYRRTFHRSETREINLYGFGGVDQFVVKGDVKRGIRVNAVGGPGPDTFIDTSRVGGFSKKTHFYDTHMAHNTWQPGSEARIHRSDDPEYNEYMDHFTYNQAYPFALPFYTSDEGFVLKAFLLYVGHAFQKKPFARAHLFSLGYTSNKGALLASYTGTFPWFFRPWNHLTHWNLRVKATFRSSSNVTNFYGLGNETVRDADTPPLIQTGLGQFWFEAPLRRDYTTGISVEIAPTLEVAQLDEEKAGDLLVLDQPGLSEPTTDAQVFAGLRATIDLDYRDDPENPRFGYTWNTTISGHWGIENTPNNYATISSALSLFASLPTRRQITLALRGGVDHREGTFPFYAASTLGGKTNLRGYLSTRFSGRSSVYANAEVRLELFRTTGTFLPGRVGVLGFVDNGRVWTDEESSDLWHQGYGGGLWYNIVDEVVLVYTRGESDEGRYTLFGFSFLF